MHTSLLTLAVAVTIATPVPKGLKQEPLYFPTTVGTKWVYQFDKSGTEQTQVVTHVRRGHQEVVVSVGQEGGSGNVVPLHTMALRADGLYMLDEVGQPYDPPVRVLKLPIKVGDRWDGDSARPDLGPVRYVNEVKEVKQIDTPAGTYQAVGIDHEFVSGAAKSSPKDRRWYVHEVGLLKLEDSRVLKSFTPGKAEPKKDK